jgi:hypothetical protein
MKQVISYSLIVSLTVASLSACSDRNNSSDSNGEKKVNVIDSRRNTTGTVNTITGDSSKVASDSAQHEIRNKPRD